MPECGERVATNFEVVDTENMRVAANEVGMVIGHMGNLEVVELNNGENYVGTGKRIVVWDARAFRVVRVAHPGKARRSRPRRSDEVG